MGQWMLPNPMTAPLLVHPNLSPKWSHQRAGAVAMGRPIVEFTVAAMRGAMGAGKLTSRVGRIRQVLLEERGSRARSACPSPRTTPRRWQVWTFRPRSRNSLRTYSGISRTTFSFRRG